MLTNSRLQLSNSEPLDRLWPVPSLVRCHDKPWFQVPSCTPWQTLTNPEFCHMSLSHILVTCPCHTPPSHPWVSQLFLDHGTHQVPTLNPGHNPPTNFSQTSVELQTKLWTKLQHQT